MKRVLCVTGADQVTNNKCSLLFDSQSFRIFLHFYAKKLYMLNIIKYKPH